MDLLFAAIWFLLGIFGLSRLWMGRSFKALQVAQSFEDRTFAGEDIRVELVLRNGGRLPIPHLRIDESLLFPITGGLGQGHVLGIGARKEARFSYTWRCPQRGYHKPPILTARVVDLLGLRERVMSRRPTEHIIVYPHIVPLQQLGLPARSSLAVLPRPMAALEDASRIIGVREYLRGDSPRRIHWTATAHASEILAKQYQPAISRETVICLDLDPFRYPVHGYDSVEQAIVVAASLTHHMTTHEKLPVGLVAEGRDAISDEKQRFSFPPRPGSNQLRAMLDVLARVYPMPNESFSDLIRSETERLSWGSTIIIITGRINESLAQTALYLKHRGHAVALISVQPSTRWMWSTSRRDLPGIPVHRVWTDSDMARLA